MKTRFMYSADEDNAWSGGGAAIVNKTGEEIEEVEEIEEEVKNETVEETKEETPEAAAEVVPEVAKEVAKEPEVGKDWRETVSQEELIAEVTKKLDRQALLRAAGIDEETIKAIEYKEATGDWEQYLKIKNTDYTKLSREQLIEMDLRERKPNADNKKFQILLKAELEKYKLDREDYDEDSIEAIVGEDSLEEDSAIIRARYIEKQSSFKAPEKQPDTTAQDREVFQQQVTDIIRNSDTVKNLQTNKLLPFGVGEEAFNYEVGEVSKLVDATITATIQSGQNPTNADINKMVKTLVYHIDPEAIEKALINHGKILGNRDVRKEVSNTKANTATTPTNYENLSDADLLAMSGKIVNRGG
jgi:hypothetical protein